MPTHLTSAVSRNALVIIAVILTGAALRWMTDIITPLLMAMFLMIMVDSFGRVIRRHARFLPSGVAIIVALVISAIAFALIAVVVADNAGGFFSDLAGDEPKLNALIGKIAVSVGLRAPQDVGQMFSRIDPSAYLGTVANTVQGFAQSALLVLIYLGFLVASRHAFERKAVKLFHDREDRQEAVMVFLRVRDGIERYLWIQTILGLVIAAASWVVMMLVGLDNALFWAFLVFIVNYIPIVGAIAAIVLPALFALVQFDGYGRAAILLAGLWTITFLVGNILLPRMQGESLNMDPLVVLLSLAFWGAIWGLTGMFLSTPLTVLAMAILAQFEGSRWIAILLSANGDPQGLGKGSEKSPDEPPAAKHAPSGRKAAGVKPA